MESILIILGALVAGAIKGSFGIGSGILPVALLSLLLPPDRVVVLLYPAMLVTTFASLIPNWGKWDVRLLYLLIIPSLIGVAIGALMLMVASTGIIRIALGFLAILFVCAEWWRLRKGSMTYEATKKVSWWKASVVGLFGGMMSSLAHAGGVVISMYLVRLGFSKEAFLATLIATMAINDVIKGVVYGFSGLVQLEDLGIAALSALAGIIGVKTGTHFLRLISVKRFREVSLGLLVISGLILIIGTR
jgi:uncharacterized membrane protein YfcA